VAGDPGLYQQAHSDWSRDGYGAQSEPMRISLELLLNLVEKPTSHFLFEGWAI